MSLDTIYIFVISMIILLLGILFLEKAFQFFSPAYKEKRRVLNEQIAESHRLYDEEIARQERARRDRDDAMAVVNAEVDWRKEGVM